MAQNPSAHNESAQNEPAQQPTTRHPAGRRQQARIARQALALLGAAALVGVAAAPAAAATVAQASATAVRVTVDGMPNDSGTYTARNDGDGETTTGNNRPEASALGGQDVVSAGTLAQDATAQVIERRGVSAACAGLAGDGATVAQAGDGTCLSGGQNTQLAAGSIDLGDLGEIVGGSLPLPVELPSEELDPIVDALNDAVAEVSATLGDPGLFLDLGAVQSRCTAGPGTAEGTASIANSSVYVQLLDERLDLVSLPVNPPPNTHVATNLDALATAVQQALREQFATALDGQLGPVGGPLDDAQEAIIEDALSQVAPELAPLEQNVIDITLNKQVQPSSDAIVVTALDAAVLPVATQELGVEVLSLQVGESTCGPSGTVAPPPAPQPQPQPAPQAPAAKPAPQTPVAVPAGLASVESGATGLDTGLNTGLGTVGQLALGGLLVVAAGAGLAGYRRPGR